MTLMELSLALLALLITPGPTNALLALSGAQNGMRAGLRLIPIVLVCYLCTVLPLALWGAPILHRLPLLRPILPGLRRCGWRDWHLGCGSRLRIWQLLRGRSAPDRWR